MPVAGQKSEQSSWKPLGKVLPGVPFMRLPEDVPPRLRQLIPYQLAVELRCAPVGRHHHTLTVAMADPLNVASAQRLHDATGLIIFPVACEEKDLDGLLSKAW